LRCNQVEGILTEEEMTQLMNVIRGWAARVRQDLLARLRAGGRFRR
jgi:hypothetical protein